MNVLIYFLFALSGFAGLIYEGSPPLATRTPAHNIYSLLYVWWAFKDSNLGPTGYEPVALTN